MHRKYSKRYAILSIICAITIFTSYAIAPQEPEGLIVVFLKKIAPIIILLILLVFALSIVGIIVSLGNLF